MISKFIIKCLYIYIYMYAFGVHFGDEKIKGSLFSNFVLAQTSMHHSNN